MKSIYSRGLVAQVENFGDQITLPKALKQGFGFPLCVSLICIDRNKREVFFVWSSSFLKVVKSSNRLGPDGTKLKTMDLKIWKFKNPKSVAATPFSLLVLTLKYLSCLLSA